MTMEDQAPAPQAAIKAGSALLDGRRFAVVGAGVSGLAAARLLLSLGKTVRLLDDRDAGDSAQVAPIFASGAEAAWGPFTRETAVEALKDCDYAILSPGVSIDHAVPAAAARLGIPVFPEIELAWLRSDGAKTVAITGTNGKTTVTMLMRHLAACAGANAIETGNIGHAFSDAVMEEAGRLPETVFLAEVSSFQLETLHDFAPDVAILLNVTPDHLDRHGTMANYAAAKARITERQTAEQVLVVNQDDPECLRIASHSRAVILRFSVTRPVDAGAWLDDDQLVWAREGAKPKKLLDLDEIPLFGMHNVENCLAAACAGLALGYDRRIVAEAIKTFTAPPHRLEPVGEIAGVQYVNDSKGTNIDAMIKALTSFNQPIHLIAGGKDKNSPFAAAIPHLRGRVERAYLIGECEDKIAAAWGDAAPISRCGTLDRALEEAARLARPGEIVLLSPGCASFDQFRSYAHRGETFRQWVAARAAAGATATPVAGEETRP